MGSRARRGDWVSKYKPFISSIVNYLNFQAKGLINLICLLHIYSLTHWMAIPDPRALTRENHFIPFNLWPALSMLSQNPNQYSLFSTHHLAYILPSLQIQNKTLKRILFYPNHVLPSPSKPTRVQYSNHLFLILLLLFGFIMKTFNFSNRPVKPSVRTPFEKFN